MSLKHFLIRILIVALLSGLFASELQAQKRGSSKPFRPSRHIDSIDDLQDLTRLADNSYRKMSRDYLLSFSINNETGEELDFQIAAYTRAQRRGWVILELERIDDGDQEFFDWDEDKKNGAPIPLSYREIACIVVFAYTPRTNEQRAVWVNPDFRVRQGKSRNVEILEYNLNGPVESESQAIAVTDHASISTGDFDSEYGTVHLDDTEQILISGTVDYENGGEGFLCGLIQEDTLYYYWWNRSDYGAGELEIRNRGRKLKGEWVDQNGNSAPWNLSR